MSTLGPAAVTLAGQRRTDPRQLGQLLRGELDWVVMKCLEKERSRRYQTADALARDVARYLADEPVEACPPSAGYRLGKFLRKHRWPLLTAAAFLVLLAAAGVLAGWQAVREARAERYRALEQAKHAGAVRDALDQVRALREEARKERDAGKWARAREQAQRAQALLESGPDDESLVAQVRQVQEELDEELKDRGLVAELDAARLAQVETVAGENRFAAERALPLYRKAFRAYGLAVGEGDPAVAAARLLRRPPEVRQAVSAALEEWLALAIARPDLVRQPSLDWLRVLAAAELDGGGLREMRAAWQERGPTRRRAALERVAAAADVLRLPPLALALLARALQAVQATASAEQLLRRAWRQYPEDFWINDHLGRLVLETKPQHWAEAVRFLTAAVALRPDTPGAHLNLGSALRAGGQVDEAIACAEKAIALDHRYAKAHTNLGNALADKGKMDEAIACWRKAIALDPKDANAYYNLGTALADKGQVDEAIACLKKAIDLDPRYARAHCNLGEALKAKGKVDEALACFKTAIDLDPKLAQAHTGLGAILCDVKRDYDEAIACFKKAIALDPKYALAHTDLGVALYGKGQVDEAIACFKKAIALDPKDAVAHFYLGTALYGKNQWDEAIACFKKAIALDPKHANAHYCLGDALRCKGQVEEAIACYHKAIAINPKHAEAHCNLGNGLMLQGRFAESLAAYKQGHALGTKQPGWSFPSAQWLRQAERLAKLEGRLPGLLEGRDRPASVRESLDLAQMCRLKRLTAAAARFWTDALATEPRLAANLNAGHRYNAACSAALAAAGKGEDAARLSDSQRLALRRRALTWLQADSSAWTRLFAAGKVDRSDLARALTHWQKDADLAGIRDREALAKLPAQEQKAFAQLWSDVAALLAKTGAPRRTSCRVFHARANVTGGGARGKQRGRRPSPARRRPALKGRASTSAKPGKPG
jgi:tetratricopeptide (TPR) repeat protein